MPKPVITEQQGQRIMEALSTWGRIYREEKGKYPEWNYANITKSCLLGRLIYDGKEPLPDPPPRYLSAPWYSLIEKGRSHLLREFAMFRHGDKIAIGQDDGWTLVKEWPDGTLLLEYPRNGRWVLRAVTEDDEQVVGGHTLVDGDGRPLDKPEPVYCDTIIEREEGSDA